MLPRFLVVFRKIVDVADPGSVREQMVDRDLVAIRIVTHVLAQWVVHAQTPLLREQQDGGSCKWLRDRSDMKASAQRVGNAQFHIGQAVRFFEFDLAVIRHQNRARKIVSTHIGQQIGINACRQRQI